MISRRQLPVASPVSPRALVSALVDSIHPAPDLVARAVDAVANAFRADRVRLTDSGTSALVLALRLAVPDGGAVALPAYGCVDLGAAALFAGVRVRLYDVDPVTLSPDIDSVRHALDRGVDAIVVAHFFGYPADVPAVRDLTASRGVAVIEDAAQGAGGSLHEKRLGALSDLAVLSFGRGKGLCAGGGGALIASGNRWLAGVDQLHSLGSGTGWSGLVATTAQWVLGRPSLYALPSMLPWLRLGEMVYHPACEPCGMSLASASLAPSAFALEQSDLVTRRVRASEIEQVVRSVDSLAAPRSIAGGAPGFLRYAVRDLTRGRESVARLGIARPYPRLWAEAMDLGSLLESPRPSTPGATELAASLFTLPTHRFVSRSDIAALAMWANSISP